MTVEASVDGYVVDALLEEIVRELSIGAVMTRDWISPIEELVAGQANYFDFLLKELCIGEIVHVRSNDDHAVPLFGQCASEMLGVFFYPSDVWKVVGGKYAEGFLHDLNRFFVCWL